MNVPIAQCADERNDQEGQIGGDTDGGVGQDLQPDRTTFAKRLPKGSSQQQDEGMNASLILSASLPCRIKIPIPDLTCLCELSRPTSKYRQMASPRVRLLVGQFIALAENPWPTLNNCGFFWSRDIDSHRVAHHP